MPVLSPGFAAAVSPVLRLNTSRTQPPRYTIAGVVRDSTGTPLAGAAVEIFETASGLLRGSATTDANGKYTIDVTGGQGLTFFATAYSSDGTLAGVTVNTLVGV
jgi:protocatechuate 3,4-dioxygenase beta subunit